VNKSELTNGNLKQFIRYINSIGLEKINHSNEQRKKCKITIACSIAYCIWSMLGIKLKKNACSENM